MPLSDHFRSPVNDTHAWNEFHAQWPGELVRNLCTILPAGYRAAPRVYLGFPFEVDIGTHHLDPTAAGVASGGGGAATLSAVAPTLTVEADLPEQDEYEVRVYDAERGRTPVAAIEIVSPSNKDRVASRKLSVGKVAALLHRGVCVTLVDLVSIRPANLYAELLALLDRTDPQLSPTPPPMYAVTLRARKPPKRRTLLDAWFYPMAVGQALPTLPIWLTPELHILLPLETSYAETCRVLGIA
jgi:hypothetical protein